jgi:hypothetical protein
VGTRLHGAYSRRGNWMLMAVELELETVEGEFSQWWKWWKLRCGRLVVRRQ